MKVSPECFIQLCQRQNIAQGKEKGILFKSKVKRTGKGILVKSRQKGQRKVHY